MKAYLAQLFFYKNNVVLQYMTVCCAFTLGYLTSYISAEVLTVFN